MLQFQFIKMRTLSLWMIGLLCTSLTGVHGLDVFPKNFETAKRDQTATLHCGKTFSEEIRWMFENRNVGNGQTLTVESIDVPTLGEYSCWNGDEMLSSTYLLLDSDDKAESELECQAKSYDCNFTCILNNSKYKVARLGLGKNCIDGEESCQWITHNKASDGSFQFEVSHSLSPYEEESTMLSVTAEAIDEEYSIQQMIKRFYLRDIVQPDSPQIVKCEEVEQGLNVTVEPPINWSTPHSYYSLDYEIQYTLKDNGKIQNSSSIHSPSFTLIPKDISTLKVRCRESLVPSKWSRWSDLKNVATGKKLCKCKNREKFCCPELPSGYLDACLRRKKKGKKIRSGVRHL